MSDDGIDISVPYQDWSDHNDPYHKESFCRFQAHADMDLSMEVLDCYLVRNSKNRKTLTWRLDKTQILQLRDYLISEFPLDQFPIGNKT